MSWSDDKELSLGADAIGWNSLKKKKKLPHRRVVCTKQTILFPFTKIIKKKKKTLTFNFTVRF